MEGCAFFPVEYRNMGQAHGVVRDSGPGEIPMFAGPLLELQAVGPVFGAGEKSGAVGPDRELVGMIGINRLGQQAVVEVHVPAGIFGIAHQHGHAGGVGLHAGVERGDQAPVGDQNADDHQPGGEDDLRQQD